MGATMELLMQKIRDYGSVPMEGVLKIDSFLNHIVDPHLLSEIGKELALRFKDKKIDKVITLEASGIAPAFGTALALNVPLLFAKKALPSTMVSGYQAEVHSFTKKRTYNIFASKEYILEGERILIVDDLLATGNAILGMKKLIELGGAHCVGAGIVIEKSFQNGREILKEHGIEVESLVRLKQISPPNHVEFII